jgi:ribosomal protein S25
MKDNTRSINNHKYRMFTCGKPWKVEIKKDKMQEILSQLTLNKKPNFMEKGEKKSDLIPAGYTYLGQFIIHDMSFRLETETDMVSAEERGSNFRSPSLDLDSIYGTNQIVNASFYDQTAEKNNGRTHFLLDVILSENRNCIYDLPRKLHGEGRNGTKDLLFPIISDVRNDENILLSQLHVAFMLFHNRAVSKEMEISLKKEIEEVVNSLSVSLKTEIFITSEELYKELRSITTPTRHGEPLSPVFNPEKSELKDKEATIKGAAKKIHSRIRTLSDKSYKKIRREVKKHYHWVIVHDYLPKIVGKTIVQKLLKDFSRSEIKSLYRFNSKINPSDSNYKVPFIPLEFSTAAFRFGHSMIRERYDFNSIQTDKSIFVKGINERLPFEVDWALFFFTPKSKGNFINAIRPLIIREMSTSLPDQHSIRSIIYRNLLRGHEHSLDTGQSIANCLLSELEKGYEVLKYEIMCRKAPIMLECLKRQFEKSYSGSEISFKDFCNNSPLWFYVLMEAWIYGKEKINDSESAGGKFLGPVGGYIVAWVILFILQKDKDFFLNQKNLNWEPIYFIQEADNIERKNEFKLRAKNKNIQERGDNSMIEFLKYARVYNGGAFAEKYEAVRTPKGELKCQPKKPENPPNV